MGLSTIFDKRDRGGHGALLVVSEVADLVLFTIGDQCVVVSVVLLHPGAPGHS